MTRGATGLALHGEITPGEGGRWPTDGPAATSRARVLNLIDFLSAYDAQRNPPIRKIEDHGMFRLAGTSLPDHSAVRVRPTGETWRAVDFIALPPVPEPAPAIAELLADQSRITAEVEPQLIPPPTPPTTRNRQEPTAEQAKCFAQRWISEMGRPWTMRRPSSRCGSCRPPAPASGRPRCHRSTCWWSTRPLRSALRRCRCWRWRRPPSSSVTISRPALSNVGLDRQAIFDLMADYLRDIPRYKTVFDPDRSLYDLAVLRFCTPVMLTEHFRCLPEIIAFTNHQAYGDQIIPLRDQPPRPGWVPLGLVPGAGRIPQRFCQRAGGGPGGRADPRDVR